MSERPYIAISRIWRKRQQRVYRASAASRARLSRTVAKLEKENKISQREISAGGETYVYTRN